MKTSRDDKFGDKPSRLRECLGTQRNELLKNVENMRIQIGSKQQRFQGTAVLLDLFMMLKMFLPNY